MLTINTLPKITKRRAKRVGRGYGSGKGGHTSGRGQKGQKSRGSIPTWFEGGQLPIIRRTPFIKGKSRFKPLKPKPILISLLQLNKFEDGSVVDTASVIKMFKLNPKAISKQGLKVVSNGKLEKSLTVNLPMSASAKKAIESITPKPTPQKTEIKAETKPKSKTKKTTIAKTIPKKTTPTKTTPKKSTPKPPKKSE
jgi:large subunit ribosomal protein L15